MFVCDTNVLSAGDPLKRSLSETQKARLERTDIYLSVATVAEIEAGIYRLDRIGASAKAAALRAWWEGVRRVHADRLLPFDLKAAEEAAVLADRAIAKGHDPGWVDIQIAATAVSRGFTVLTRNARHFEPLGVRHLDPFVDPLPDL